MNESSISRAEKLLQEFGQTGLAVHLRTLPQASASRLAEDIVQLDWPALKKLLGSTTDQKPEAATVLGPISTYPFSPGQKKEVEAGETAIRSGKVALFTVAGGQGSRLGYEGPKGCFGVTPVRNAPLFQIFAEKLRAAQGHYGVEIPWVLMTSPLNDRTTQEFFAQNGYFGLKKDQLRFFTQGVMPAVDAKTGQLLLESPETLALSPDGHGGSLKGLDHSGSLKWLQGKGIELLSYFQVDNPLVKLVDPAFIGAHILSGSQFSSKATPKKYPAEKVGVFGTRGGVLGVIEYSDMPAAMTEERDTQGQLRYRWGNAAIHLLDIAFIDKVDETAALPYHRALKKVSYWSGQNTVPETPNAIKFEQFIFDAIGLSKNPIVVGIDSAEEFSPVKNATGNDSPETCRRDQLRLWAYWLKAAGIDVPLDTEGTPTYMFEISPLFADTQAALLAQGRAGRLPREITRGTVLQ